MADIHQFKVPPRTVSGAIGKHRYEISFDPELRKWRWILRIAREYEHRGTADKLEAAEKAVQREVDRHEGRG